MGAEGSDRRYPVPEGIAVSPGSVVAGYGLGASHIIEYHDQAVGTAHTPFGVASSFVSAPTVLDDAVCVTAVAGTNSGFSPVGAGYEQRSLDECDDAEWLFEGLAGDGPTHVTAPAADGESVYRGY